MLLNVEITTESLFIAIPSIITSLTGSRDISEILEKEAFVYSNY